MTRRCGFTLIELIVAITLTGIVALLAYGSVNAGLDSAERVDRYRKDSEGVALMRSLVGNALRHPSDAPFGKGLSFELVHGSGSDALRFVSRGVSGPLGAGELWRVELLPSSHGLQFSATSLDQDATPIIGTVTALRSIAVRVRSPDDRMTWQNHWDPTQQFPSGVEISFRDSAGTIASPPLIVATTLESR